jgi:hypothetical protein
MTVFLDHFVNIHAHIIDGMKCLSNNRNYYKTNFVLIRMILKHFNRCHHGTLHWRGEHNLPVNAVGGVLVVLGLADADGV